MIFGINTDIQYFSVLYFILMAFKIAKIMFKKSFKKYFTLKNGDNSLE